MSTEPSGGLPPDRILVLNPSEISPRERERLETLGKNADDHCLVVAGALAMECAVQRSPDGQGVLVFQIVVGIPHAVLPFPTNGPLDARGNAAVGSRVQAAIGCAPDVRLIVRRDAFADHVRMELDRARMLHSIGVPPGGAQS